MALVTPARWKTWSMLFTASPKDALSLQSPWTTSMGRLFNQVKSLVFRTRHRTWTPFWRRASTRWLPINPVAPVTKVFNTLPFTPHPVKPCSSEQGCKGASKYYLKESPVFQHGIRGLLTLTVGWSPGTYGLLKRNFFQDCWWKIPSLKRDHLLFFFRIDNLLERFENLFEQYRV